MPSTAGVTDHVLARSFRTGPQGYETFMVNSGPIAEESGEARGAIATFNCITELEQKTEQLEQVLVMLEKSRDEARTQYDELQALHAKKD